MTELRMGLGLLGLDLRHKKPLQNEQANETDRTCQREGPYQAHKSTFRLWCQGTHGAATRLLKELA